MSALRVSRQEFRSFIADGVVAAKDELAAEDIVALMGVAEKSHAARVGAYGGHPEHLPVPHSEEEWHCPAAQAGIFTHDGADIVARRFDICACNFAERKGVKFYTSVRVVG